MKKLIIIILLLLTIAGCKEVKSRSEALADSATINRTDWPTFGIDLPARTPILIDSCIIDQPGTYTLLWKIGVINNIMENDSNILFYAQLKINDELEFHDGFNVTSIRHYDSLRMDCDLALNAGDRVEIFVTSDSSQWYPTGGAVLDNQWYTRNFQLKRTCTMDGTITGPRR